MSRGQNAADGGPGVIGSVTELLAHAHALESEAAERYADLAAQMDSHNNAELAALFRQMAAIEAKHVAKVDSLAGGRALPSMAAWDYQWPAAEAPETAPFSGAHYRMTAHQALSLMLDCETRAVDFFARAAASAEDAAVKAMAEDLAAEEREHVALLQAWLARTPAPPKGWDTDPDDPVSQA